MCFSNHSLFSNPFSHVGGILLTPNLQPKRAPAVAPFVSASPAYVRYEKFDFKNIFFDRFIFKKFGESFFAVVIKIRNF